MDETRARGDPITLPLSSSRFKSSKLSASKPWKSPYCNRIECLFVNVFLVQVRSGENQTIADAVTRNGPYVERTKYEDRTTTVFCVSFSLIWSFRRGDEPSTHEHPTPDPPRDACCDRVSACPPFSFCAPYPYPVSAMPSLASPARAAPSVTGRPCAPNGSRPRAASCSTWGPTASCSTRGPTAWA